MFADLDNDTWEDLVVVNGFIQAASFIKNEKRSPNELWRNNGDGTFEEIGALRNGMADEGAGRSVTQADVNGDGLLDFYVQNNGSSFVSLHKDRSRLFVGNPAHHAPAHWIELDLVGRIGHPDAFGARLDLTIGGTTLKRQRLGDSPFLGSSSRMVHFGLGDAAQIDVLSIAWAAGADDQDVATLSLP